MRLQVSPCVTLGQKTENNPIIYFNVLFGWAKAQTLNFGVPML